MRALTKLEALFLESLRELLKEATPDTPIMGAYVSAPKSDNPVLQVGLKLRNEPSLLYFNVLIYGTRPVRYHLEASASTRAEASRPFWNRLLGALNLVVEKSGEKDGRFHLFYELTFPDKELKKLGER